MQVRTLHTTLLSSPPCKVHNLPFPGRRRAGLGKEGRELDDGSQQIGTPWQTPMGSPVEWAQAQHKNHHDIREQLRLALIPPNSISVSITDCCPHSLACTSLPGDTRGASPSLAAPAQEQHPAPGPLPLAPLPPSKHQTPVPGSVPSSFHLNSPPSPALLPCPAG